MATALGIVFAVALSATEQKLGFSLKSFGPIAAGIIILMTALVIYSLMRQVGAGHVSCSATALIVTYFSMRAVLPGFFLWAKQNEWANYLHSLLILAVLVALWRVIQAMFTPHEVSALKQAVQRVSHDPGGFIDGARRQDAVEWRAVRRGMDRLAVKGKRECRKVIAVLEDARQIIQEHGSEQRVAESLCKALNDLKAREHVLSNDLARIQALDQRLLRLDLSQYRDLQQRYQRLNKEQQAGLRTLFAEERQKIAAEEKIGNFLARAETYAVDFERCIDSACSCLQAGRAADAADSVGRAIEQEHEAEKIIADIREHGKVLLQILGRQIAELEAVARK
jgi:transposase